jgi:transposase
MRVRPFVREAGWELPASLDDVLPATHPVRFVAHYVDSLTEDDWQQLGIQWQEGGQGAHGYHPRVLLAAWVWGFMSGVRSSRRLEAACTDQLSCLWLTGGQCPDHNTLWRFYQAHRAGMRHLLTDTVRTAVELGLVDLALQAVDGTKVSGNAAKDRSYDRKGLDRLIERCAQAIAELEAQNQTGGEPVPARLSEELADQQHLAERLREARQTLEEGDGPRRINLSDGDAQLMPTRHGYVAGYNAQAVVSPLAAQTTGSEGMLITAADLSCSPDDYDQLLPMMAQAAQTTGTPAETTLADGGYLSLPVLEGCDARQQRVLLPVDAPAKAGADQPYHKEHFVYDAEQDQYTCPQGKVLTFAGIKRRKGHQPMRAYRAGAAVCKACPAFGICTKDRRKGRLVEVTEPHPRMVVHQALMATQDAKAQYARRKELVEPVFGVIKEQQGLRRFLLRGKEQVRAEWRLLAAAFNLRTLARIWQQRPALFAW